MPMCKQSFLAGIKPEGSCSLNNLPRSHFLSDILISQSWLFTRKVPSGIRGATFTEMLIKPIDAGRE